MSKQKKDASPIVADRLASRRKALGITQEKLCEDLYKNEGISRNVQAISAYENAQRPIPDNVLEAIARVLKTHVAYLKDETDEANVYIYTGRMANTIFAGACDGINQSQISFGSFQRIMELHFGYRFAHFLGIDMDEVYCLYKDEEEYVFSKEDAKDLLQRVSDYIEVACLRVKKQRESEDIPLFERAKICESRKVREALSQIDYLTPHLNSKEAPHNG